MNPRSRQGSRRCVPIRLAAPALALLILALAACSGPGTQDVEPTGAPQTSIVAQADAPAAIPVAIEIPSIDVDAAVVGVGLQADGAMQVPDFGLAGWYEPGPRPGDAGPAVVVAHVDSRSGPDVFARLSELRTGDTIVVHGDDGSALRFTAESSEQAPKDELPVGRIWSETDQPVLRLITCGGSFDHATGHYRDNVIVYARATA